MVDSDKHWVRLGRIDPYLKTVQTLDPYKLDPTLSASDGDLYFGSGERYLADLFALVQRHVVSEFNPKVAVDFGCSVGRVAIPMARRCALVIGLDVSPDALVEAQRNAARFEISNARWLSSDDHLSKLDEPIDFFHSYNVLQHLPVSRGLSIVRRALSLLAPGGVIAIHVPYADRASSLRHAVNWAQANVPSVHWLANVARGRALGYPHMLMNPYDLTTLLALMRDQGCEEAHCKFIDQGRYPGAILIAQMSREKKPAVTSSE